MDSTFLCAGNQCIRQACCRIDENKLYCYFHFACDGEGATMTKKKLEFFDVKTAKKQATEFRQVATHVWEDLVDELQDAQVKQNGSKKPKLALSSASSTMPQSSSSSAAKPKPASKGTFLDLVHANTDTGTPMGSLEDEMSTNFEGPCQFCGETGRVRYRCISASIDARKADTWGSSGRPDRVLRYSCSACLRSWYVEEG